MRTIHKQHLKTEDYQTIEVPLGFEIIHVGVQHGEPTIWYECDTEMPIQIIEILCFGTGFKLPDSGTPDGAVKHIGSFVTNDDFCVWHFYQKLGLTKLK